MGKKVSFFLKGDCEDPGDLLWERVVSGDSCFPLSCNPSWVGLTRGRASEGRRKKRFLRQVEINSYWADVGAGSCMICHERAGRNLISIGLKPAQESLGRSEEIPAKEVLALWWKTVQEGKLSALYWEGKQRLLRVGFHVQGMVTRIELSWVWCLTQPRSMNGVESYSQAVSPGVLSSWGVKVSGSLLLRPPGGRAHTSALTPQPQCHGGQEQKANTSAD